MLDWVSIDPSTKTPGLAFWRDNSLVYAESMTAVNIIDLRSFVPASKVVIEVPQVYRTTPNPKSLIDLTFAAGYLAATFGPGQVVKVLPREWKGQVPKDVMIERIKSKLTEQEMKMVSLPKNKKHAKDVWDAVGIGLFHGGRL